MIFIAKIKNNKYISFAAWVLFFLLIFTVIFLYTLNTENAAPDFVYNQF